MKVLETQLREQTEKSTQLQGSLDTSRSQADEVAKQLEAMTASLAETKQELARRTADWETEKSNSAYFLEDIQTVKQQSSALRQQLDESEARQRALQSQCEAQQRQIEVGAIEQKRLEASKASVDDLIAVLEKQLQLKTQLETELKMETPSEGEKASEEGEKMSELRSQLELKSQEIERLAAEVTRLQSELQEREEAILAARSEASSLRIKESESIRSGEMVRSQEKEMESLHAKLQKNESRFNEEKLKIESRVSFAEQSLEAYKKEMEGYLREKMTVEAELKQNREELAQLKKANEV